MTLMNMDSKFTKGVTGSVSVALNVTRYGRSLTPEQSGVQWNDPEAVLGVPAEELAENTAEGVTMNGPPVAVRFIILDSGSKAVTLKSRFVPAIIQVSLTAFICGGLFAQEPTVICISRKTEPI